MGHHGTTLVKERSLSDSLPASAAPILVALGLFIATYGMIYSYWVVIPGVAVVFYGIIGWFREHF